MKTTLIWKTKKEEPKDKEEVLFLHRHFGFRKGRYLSEYSGIEVMGVPGVSDMKDVIHWASITETIMELRIALEWIGFDATKH